MRGRTAVVPSPSRAVLLRGRIAFAWVCGMALLAVSGCGASGKQTLRLGNGDAGRRLIAAVGDTIEVTLQTIGPGHYGSPVLSSGSVVFLGESSAGPPIPAGPTQLYRFEAVASGLAEITIAHTGGPTEGPAIPPFVLTVGVP